MIYDCKHNIYWSDVATAYIRLNLLLVSILAVTDDSVQLKDTSCKTEAGVYHLHMCCDEWLHGQVRGKRTAGRGCSSQRQML